MAAICGVGLLHSFSGRRLSERRPCRITSVPRRCCYRGWRQR